MTFYTDAEVEAAWDALDAAHETTYHVHAGECCIETDKYVRAVLDAVAPAIAARALVEAEERWAAEVAETKRLLHERARAGDGK